MCRVKLYNVLLFCSGKKKLVNRSRQQLVGKIVEQVIFLTAFNHIGKKLWTITGTPLSAHFGGPKFLYMTQNNKKLASKIEQGELYFGSLSAFPRMQLLGQLL